MQSSGKDYGTVQGPEDVRSDTSVFGRCWNSHLVWRCITCICVFLILLQFILLSKADHGSSGTVGTVRMSYIRHISTTSAVISAGCPVGSSITGGGCECDAAILQGYPDGAASVWFCECSTISLNNSATAICLTYNNQQ